MFHPREAKVYIVYKHTHIYTCIHRYLKPVVQFLQLPVDGIVSSWKNIWLHELNNLSAEFLSLENFLSDRCFKWDWWGGIGHGGLKMSIIFNFVL